MADRLLIFEDGEVRLGDFVVPGILRSQTVRGAVRFDDVKQEGHSGTTKKAMGWDDADISLSLDLVTDETMDCYARLESINAVFRRYDKHADPMVYTVVNRHLRARGVDQVVFAGLESTESDKEDVIACTLHFVEHNPPIVAVEKQLDGSGNEPPATVTNAGDGEVDPALIIGVD